MHTHPNRPVRREWCVLRSGAATGGTDPLVSGLTTGYWNDPEDQRAMPGVMTENKKNSRVRSILRRLDAWTLTVFNPYIHANHRR